MMGELVSIVYKPKGAAPAPDGYTRISLERAELLAGRGIDGDAKGGGVRQLNIMCAETVAALEQEGFRAAPGQLGEQLIVAGLPIDTLPVGAILQIGETARVEVVEPRVGCGKFEQYQTKLRQQASRRLGVMARVLTDGAIQVGSPVVVIQSSGTTEK
ncbi:MAG: MOSC domain-containing protein [Armatimonadota bacterium]|nr:MOSC domain-containing protein [Armatimonadota bacterium]